MKKKLFYVFLFVLFFSAVATAQERTITGTVRDANGLEMLGVAVVVKGENHGTQTDMEGRYSIKVAPGKTLEFSFLGMKTQSHKVGTSSRIDVVLQEEAVEIGEVVVLGVVKKKAAESTGNTVQLSSKDISTPSAISVDQALQGKTPGVVINAASGTPGAEQTVMIRGVGSMNSSNKPLYVIDGVPVITENLTEDKDTFSSMSTLASINNEDIESLTVLKDAAATALYGARGSNGVIVITTKSGKRGKTKFNVNTSVGFQNDAYFKRSPLTGDQRYHLLKQGLANQFANRGVTYDNAIDFAHTNGLRLNGAENFDSALNNNNWSELIKNKNAVMTSADISASGGDEKGTYYVSLGYNRTEPTVKTSDPFKRVSGVIKINRDLNDKLKLEASVNGSWVSQNPIAEQAAFFTNPYLAKVMMSPWANPYNADGSYNVTTFNRYTGLYNYLYLQEHDIVKNNTLRGLVNFKVDYELLKNLVFSTRANVDYISSDYKSYRNRIHSDDAKQNGSSQRIMTHHATWVYQNTLSYNFNVAEKHKFGVTALYEYQKYKKNYLEGYGSNIAADGLTNLVSVTKEKKVYSTFEDWANVSLLGMLNYSYAEKYILDASIRREGSSRFAKGNRYGNFWSLGLAYNLHKEFEALGKVFNELKLRASYGLTGNSGVELNKYQVLLAYDADYAENGAAYPKTLGNDDLTWEKNRTFDVGLNFALFNQRLRGSVAYYDKYTYDLLLNVPLSRTTGFEEQAINTGAMSNKGVEASLGVDIIRNKNFTWNLSANIATVKNRVEELAKDGTGADVDPTAGSAYKQTKVGETYAYWYMPTWAGVNVTTGLPEWYDKKGEKTSDYNLAERRFQGIAIPKYSGGLSTHLQYKGVFLDATVYFTGGHKVYERFAQFYLRTNNFTTVNYNGDAELLNAWQKPGDVTDVPKITYSGADNFHDVSSRHLYDGTFARLKDITLGYEVPSKYLEGTGFDGVTFTLRGTNLYTWVKDSGLKLDPEVGNKGNTMGYTTLTAPPVKSVVFGVNLKF